MFIPPVRVNGPATRQRWLVLTALALAAAVAAGLQFTSAALFPREKTAALAGVAVGLVLGSAALWVQRRVEGDG